MNILSFLPSIRAFLAARTQPSKDVSNLSSPFPQLLESKADLGCSNDTTMATEINNTEHQSHPIQQNQKVRSKNSAAHARQSWCGYEQIFNSSYQKRHDNILYFDCQGNKLEQGQPSQIYDAQQAGLRKRERSSADVEDFERAVLLRKFTNGEYRTHEIPNERQENYFELQLQMSKGDSRLRHASKHQDPAITQVKLVRRPSRQPVLEQPRYVELSDMPHLGEFSLNYTTSQLMMMSHWQLANLPKLTISTHWGSLRFLEPVSLFRKNVELCLTMEWDQIEIYDQEWSSKAFQLTVYYEIYSDQYALARVRVEAAKLGLTKCRSADRSDALVFYSE